MNDPYLIPGTSVLKNKLNLTLQPDLDEAEADYAALRLRELAVQPLPGNYGVDKLTAWFSHDMAALWKIHAFREGNTRTTIHFCCQFSDEHGFSLDRGLFEENSHYFRTALVAYNAVFSDIGDKSRKEYLERIMRDAIERGMGIYRQKG